MPQRIIFSQLVTLMFNDILRHFTTFCQRFFFDNDIPGNTAVDIVHWVYLSIYTCFPSSRGQQGPQGIATYLLQLSPCSVIITAPFMSALHQSVVNRSTCWSPSMSLTFCHSSISIFPIRSSGIQPTCPNNCSFLLPTVFVIVTFHRMVLLVGVMYNGS